MWVRWGVVWYGMVQLSCCGKLRCCGLVEVRCCGKVSCGVV